jgi:DNA-binding MarR family transcriptional regulator
MDSAKVPYWIIDSYLAVLSGTAFKVFVYLVRKANFDPKSHHFGRCWPSRKEIADAAGVSETNLSKQMKELESHGLIKRSKNQPFRKHDGTFGSSRLITVTHFGRMKELKGKKV